MNRKVLLITLMGICYAPTPDTTSTFVTTPLMMRMVHQFNKNRFDERNLEMATYNAHETPLPRQTAVFDLIDCIFMYPEESKISPYNASDLKREIEAKAARVTQEFHIDSDTPMYDDLVHAVRMKRREIKNNFRRDSDYYLKAIYDLVPLMIPAIFEDTINTENGLLFQEYYGDTHNVTHLFQTIELSSQLKDNSDNPAIQQIATNTMQKAMIKLLSLTNNNNDYKDIISLAGKLKNNEILDMAFQKWLDHSAGDLFITKAYIEVANLAHKMSNIKWENKAFEKAFAAAAERNEVSAFTYIADEANGMKNDEWRDMAFEKALALLEHYPDYINIINKAIMINNEELLNKTFDLAFENIQEYNFYFLLIEEMGSFKWDTKWESKVFEKALDLAQDRNFLEIMRTAHQIGSEELQSKVFERMSTSTNNHSDYIRIATDMISIRNNNYTQKAYEKALDAANSIMECLDVAKEARIWSDFMLYKTIEKAQELAQTDEDKAFLKQRMEELGLNLELIQTFARQESTQE